MEIYVDDETKLTLHGLKQHYVNLLDKEKNRKLFGLLDALDFNQVCNESINASFVFQLKCNLGPNLSGLTHLYSRLLSLSRAFHDARL